MAAPGDSLKGRDSAFIRGYFNATKGNIERIEASLSHLDTRTQEAAKTAFRKQAAGITRLHEYVEESPVGAQTQEIKALCERYITIGEVLGEEIPAALRGGSAPPSPSSGAGTGGEPAADAPPEEAATTATLKAEFAPLLSEPISTTVIEKIGKWAETNSLDRTTFLNTMFGEFYHLVKNKIESGTAFPDDIQKAFLEDPQFGEHLIGDDRLKQFVFPAIALALAKMDEPYIKNAPILVEGTEWSFQDFTKLYLAEAAGVNPEVAGVEEIAAHPLAFIHGLRSARSYLASHSGAKAGDGAAAPAAASAASSGAPAAAVMPAGLHGMSNSGNDCWAISMTQFIRHARGLGADYLRKLPETPARNRLLEVLERYDSGESAMTLAQAVRTGFRETVLPASSQPLGGITTARGQHDAGEAAHALLCENAEGESGWIRTTSRPHPHEARMIEETVGSESALIDGYVQINDGEMNIPKVLLREQAEGEESSVHFIARPDQLCVALSYESLHSGGMCPTSFVLPGRMIVGDDLPPVNMDLDAAIVHHGSAPLRGHHISGGHYTTVVRKGDTFYHCNDSRITPITPARAQELLTPSKYSRPVTAHYVRTGGE